MKMGIVGFLSFFCVLSGASGRAFAAIESELTAAQLNSVRSGQQVLLTQNVDGSAWPKIFVYQKVNATPEEVEAVVSDYELTAKYMPDVESAKITDQIDKTTAVVDSRWHVVIASEELVMKYTIAKDPSIGGFRCDWTMVKGDATRSVVGNTRLEPFEGGTLMAYYMFTNPTSGLAGLVRNQAIQQVSASSNAFARQCETERKSNPALLDKQLVALHAALGF